MSENIIVASHKDIPYGTSTHHKLDLYIPSSFQPDEQGKPLRIVYLVHGGAWAAEDKADYQTLGESLAIRTGFPTILPNYRLTPHKPTPETELRHPAHAEDILASLEFALSSTPSVILPTNVTSPRASAPTYARQRLRRSFSGTPILERRIPQNQTVPGPLVQIGSLTQLQAFRDILLARSLDKDGGLHMLVKYMTLEQSFCPAFDIEVYLLSMARILKLCQNMEGLRLADVYELDARPVDYAWAQGRAVEAVACLWAAVPQSVIHLELPRLTFIPLNHGPLAPITHRNIRILKIRESNFILHPVKRNPFPNATHFHLGLVQGLIVHWDFPNLQHFFIKERNISYAHIYGEKRTSLTSVELHRDIKVGGYVLGYIFQRSPNLRELRYGVQSGYNPVTSFDGWDAYFEDYDVVGHTHLRVIEVLVQYDAFVPEVLVSLGEAVSIVSAIDKLCRQLPTQYLQRSEFPNMLTFRVVLEMPSTLPVPTYMLFVLRCRIMDEIDPEIEVEVQVRLGGQLCECRSM